MSIIIQYDLQGCVTWWIFTRVSIPSATADKHAA